MSTEKNNFSRRSFLTGAGIAAASAAAMGIAGCSSPKSSTEKKAATASEAVAENPVSTGDLTWLGDEPTISDSQVESTVEADVIVVGTGVAGTAATRSAAEAGAKVINFEKAESTVCRSGEYAVINGDLEARWGRNAFDTDVIVDHHMDECGYKTKRSIMSKWAENFAPVFDWYIGAKEDLYICETTRSEVPDANKDSFLIPVFYPLPEKYDWTKEEHPVYPTTVELLPNQAPVLAANMAKAIATGNVSNFYGHFVEKLIKEDGRIVGCYARNAETGKYVKATAKKGLVLATGDYSSNKDILEYYAPEVVAKNIQTVWTNKDVEGNNTNTGDGLKLGAWVDARIQEHHAPMIHHMGGRRRYQR